MINRFYDLTIIQQADGSIRLTQSDHGEDYIIDVHPEQVLFVARHLCGMKPQAADTVAELERRIAVLTDKLQNLVCNKAFRSDLIEGIGDGFEYLAKLDAVLDLALEFDGGRLLPVEPPDDATEAPPTCTTTKTSATTQTDGQLGLPV